MHGLWSRIRKGRLFQVLAVYLGASWLILEVAVTLRDNLGLPDWIFAAAFIVLLAGLVVVLATAWVQSHPLVEQRAAAEEVPHAWELDAADLRSALRAGRLPHLTWARAVSGGVIVMLLLFGFGGLYVVIRDRGVGLGSGTAEAAVLPGVAVLPFEIRGEGLETLREGIGGLLNANMDGFEGLRPIDSRTVLARWRERVGGQEADLATALGVARATQARYAVIGEGVRLGERVHLTATVYDLRDGSELGVVRANGAVDSVGAVVDALSVAVLTTVLDLKDGAPRRRYLAAATTSSPRALWAFLAGEERFRRADGPGAIAAYRRAVELDSTFALAQFRLSRAYAWTEWTDSAAPRHSELAYRYADRLPPREAALIRAVHDRGLRGRAESNLAQFEMLARSYPDDAEVWLELGDTYYHVAESMLISRDKAAAAFDSAIALDSAFWPSYSHRIFLAMRAESVAEAQRLVDAYSRHAPTPAARLAAQLAFALVHGDSAAQRHAIAALDTIAPEALMPMGLFLPPAPRGLSAARVVFEAIARRPVHQRPPGLRSEDMSDVPRMFMLAEGGRMREFASTMRRAAASPAAADLRPLLQMLLLWPDLSGTPLPADIIDPVLSADTSIFGALHAALRSQWDRHTTIVAGLRRQAAAASDAYEANALQGRADVAEGFGLWQRGRREDALAVLERGRQRTTGMDFMDFQLDSPNLYSRQFLALLNAELGRYEDALRYYATLPGVLTRFEQAEIQLKLGETAKARQGYAECLEAWRDADPDFPYAVRARAALDALTRERS